MAYAYRITDAYCDLLDRTYEGNWRILTGSVDCTLIMWDVLGTTIRVDNTSHFVDTEVDQMPIAELAV